MSHPYNPYPRDTQKHRVLEVLKDLRWHCSECELPGSQPAKVLQQLRQDGFELEKVGSNWERRQHCTMCGRSTPHRRLVSLARKTPAIARSSIPPAARARIIGYYGGRDAILGYAPTGRSVEIDHRVPEVRWKVSEAVVSPNITDAEIEERFVLLVREHNLLKSRHCERCVATGERQPLMGVQYFYVGDARYDEALGCEGCGWHSPERWRRELNALVRGKCD